MDISREHPIPNETKPQRDSSEEDFKDRCIKSADETLRKIGLAAPTLVPLEAREWLRNERVRLGIYATLTDERAADLMERYSSHVNAALMERLEQTEVQLSGCGVAALGWNAEPATKGQYGWSPAYQDTLDLRKKWEAAESRISVLERERDASIKELGKVSREAGNLESQLSTLREALSEAIETIRLWHGMGMPKDLEVSQWRRYKESPEMKRLLRALTPPTTL